jgi:hypothetical protein
VIPLIVRFLKTSYRIFCLVLPVLKRVAILMDVHSCKPKSMTITSAKTPNIRGTRISRHNHERKNRMIGKGAPVLCLKMTTSLMRPVKTPQCTPQMILKKIL